MDECPHCGEPIDEDAQSCRHCGSDHESGWKPFADEESVELPEDDDSSLDFEPEQSSPTWETVATGSVIVAAAVAFLIVSWLAYRTTMPLVLFSLLLLSFLAFHRRLVPRRRGPY